MNADRNITQADGSAHIGPDEITHHQIANALGSHDDAIRLVAGNDVARLGGIPADRVVRPDDDDPDRIANYCLPACGRADEVALHQVLIGLEFDTVNEVAGDDIPGTGDGPANRV